MKLKCVLGAVVAMSMALVAAAAERVVYLDWNEETRRPVEVECETYAVYGGETTLAAGTTYVVAASQTVSSRIVVEGTEENPTRLVLCDCATLTATKGVEVAEGKSIVMYGQELGTGTLDATGASYTAGIGGKRNVAGGTVTINGGTIKANGGVNAAGIGGGRNGKGGVVTVNGGTVVAHGGFYGAGIGGGDYGDGAVVTVNGGMVTAVSEGYGAGIGGGCSGAGDEVTINGGIVTAYSTDLGIDEEGYYIGGFGIGAGFDYDEEGTVVFGSDYAISAGFDQASATEMTMRAYKNDHSAAFVSLKPVINYPEWDDVKSRMTNVTCQAYEVVTNEMCVFEAGKTYVVMGNVTNTTGIVVQGTTENPTRLVLLNGVRLSVDASARGAEGAAGIELAEGKKLMLFTEESCLSTLRVKGAEGGVAIGGAQGGAAGTLAFGGNYAVKAGDGAETAQRYTTAAYAADMTAKYAEIEPALGTREHPWVVSATGDVDVWTNGMELVVHGTGTVDVLSTGIKGWNYFKDDIMSINVPEVSVTGMAPDAFAGVGNPERRALVILPDKWDGVMPREDELWYGAYVETMALPSVVRDVTFRQRYPWNGKVDIGFTVTGLAGKQYIAVSMLTNGTEKVAGYTTTVTIPASGILETNIVWDVAAAGIAPDFISKDVTINVAAVVVDSYMVVDLNANSRGKFVVSFEELTADEANAKFNAPGDDTYKTSKLVLRKVAANAEGYVCEPGAANFPVTAKTPVARDYWMGLFEVTAAQYDRVMGVAAPSNATTPVNLVSYETIRGTADPAIAPMDPAAGESFMKRLCANSVDTRGRPFGGFDLPTAAQWEIACRADGTDKYNCGGELTADVASFGFDYSDPNAVPQVVGSKQPNAWSLYDMHGNVAEWCRDVYVDSSDWVAATAEAFCVASEGAERRVLCGGCYLNTADECATSYRSCNVTTTAQKYFGFRLCRTTTDDEIAKNAELINATSGVGDIDLFAGDRVAKSVETLVVDPAWGAATEATVAIDGEESVRTFSAAAIDTWETAELAPGRYVMMFEAGETVAKAAFWKMGEDWVIVDGETFTEDTTFEAGKTYLVRGTNTVAAGCTLTVEPDVKFHYVGESESEPTPAGVGFRFEGEVSLELDRAHRIVDVGDGLVSIGEKIKGGEDNPWEVGPDAVAYTNGTELVIGGEGVVTPLADVPGLNTLLEGLTEITISTDAVTGASEDAFAGVGSEEAPVLITLPDGWQGELPDEDGFWYGVQGELARMPTAVKNVVYAQDWPWSGLVEIGFALTGDEGEKNLVLTVCTNGTDVVFSTDIATMIPEGGVLETNLVWDALAADLGEFVSDEVTVTVSMVDEDGIAATSAKGTVDVRTTVALPEGVTTVAGVDLPMKDGTYTLTHPTDEEVTSFATFVVSGFPLGCATNPMPLGIDEEDAALAVTNGLDVVIVTERAIVDAEKFQALCGDAEMEGWLVSPDGSTTNHVEMLVGSDGQTFQTIAEAMAADVLPETFELLTMKVYWVTYDPGADAQGEPQPAGEMSVERFVSAVATNLAANAFTRDDFEFGGWKGVTNGVEVVYHDQEAATDFVQPGETLALTAQWTRVAQWVAVTNLANATWTVTTNGVAVETVKVDDEAGVTLYRVATNADVTVTFRAMSGYALSVDGERATVNLKNVVYGERDVVSKYPTVIPISEVLMTELDGDGNLVITGAKPTMDGVLTIPGEIDGVKVATIAPGAFAFNADVTEVVIEEGVTQIGGAAFDACPLLERVEIPASVTNIGTVAFSRCGELETVVFAGDAPTFDQPTVPGYTTFNGSNEGLVIQMPEDATGWDDPETLSALCPEGTKFIKTQDGYRIGSDAEPPTISKIVLVSASEVELTVINVNAGFTYKVERCATLGGEWEKVAEAKSTIDGELKIVAPIGGSQAFYRIVVGL